MKYVLSLLNQIQMILLMRFRLSIFFLLCIQLLYFTSPLQAEKKILFVGFVPDGGEEQIVQRNIPGCVMNGFYEAWGKIIKELKSDDIKIYFTQNGSFCRGWKTRDVRWKQFKDKYDLFIFHDLPPYLNRASFPHLGHKSIVILSEPSSVIPTEYNRKILKRFACVMTWRDDWAGKRNMRKFHYPVFVPYKGGDPFEQRKFSCMMCGDKGSSTPGELYSERRKIIRFFSRYPHHFELYGPGWAGQNIPVYKGQVPFKYEVLKHHRFNFCLENMSKDIGYVTEKIFDAFEAGCIPIYTGSSNISDFIPSDCYIDYTKFNNLDDLYKFMLEFSEADYHRYQDNIKRFLESSCAQKFSVDFYVETFTRTIRELINSQNVKDSYAQ